jgi:hypothetical protein
MEGHVCINAILTTGNVLELEFQMKLNSYTIINVKNFQFKVSVKDDNYDACKTANIKI